MSTLEKLIAKFHKNPHSVNYKELKKILGHYGYTHIQAKGSHEKWKHPAIKHDLIIPIHNNDCKEFYKKLAYKHIKSLTNK